MNGVHKKRSTPTAKRCPLSRRTILRGLVGGSSVALALPLLNTFLNDNGTAFADGTALPRRFGWWFWGNGVIPDRFRPLGAGQGDAWSLSEQLAPLAGVKEKLTVVSGTSLPVQKLVPHGSGPGGIFTGSDLISYGGEEFTFALPSIDQIVAEQVGGDSRFRSLELGVQRSTFSYSHNGPDSLNPPETDPHALYQRLFGPEFRAPGDEPIVDPRIGYRRSVLDAVSEHSQAAQMKVGREDRARLEEHFNGIRELERRLQRLEDDPPNLASCMRPSVPEMTYPDVDGRPQLAARNEVMSQMLAMALACNQTQVFSMMFSQSVNNVLFTGAPAGHHNLTHDEPGAQPEVNSIVVSIVEQFARTLEILDAVPEGDGTLLDNCAILGTTDVALGKSHTLEDYPVVIAGSCCGALKTNVHYESPAAENSAKVCLSLLRAMGVPAGNFGQGNALVEDGIGAIES